MTVTSESKVSPIRSKDPSHLAVQQIHDEVIVVVISTRIRLTGSNSILSSTPASGTRVLFLLGYYLCTEAQLICTQPERSISTLIFYVLVF
jgi:hypothetical protein